MMSLQDVEKVYYHTTSMCPTCGQLIPASVEARGGQVFVSRTCDDHGPFHGLICSDLEWFEGLERFNVEGIRPGAPGKDVVHGCPLDCGLCTEHRQIVGTAAMEISNQCNASCPTCLSDNRETFHVSVEEVRGCLEEVLRSQDHVDAFTLSGGEPTLHPQLFEILEVLRRPEVGRVVLDTNGIRVAEDDGFLERLAGVEGLFVCLHHDGDGARRLRGVSRGIQERALDRLCEREINVVPLVLAAQGVNEGELGEITRSLLTRSPSIKSIILSMMCYTGSNGSSFPGDPERRLTIAGALEHMGRTTGGILGQGSFMPLPMPNPLCAAVGYFLTMDGVITPLIPLVEVDRIIDFTKNANFVDPDENFEALVGDIIDSIYAHPEDYSEPEDLLDRFRRLLGILFPEGGGITQQQRSEFAGENMKLVYLMQFMDPWSFDSERMSKCSCIHLMPDRTMIPSCGYYSHYRRHDPRFMG